MKIRRLAILSALLLVASSISDVKAHATQIYHYYGNSTGASSTPEESASPTGQPSPSALVPGDAVLTEVLPGVWTQGPEIDCADGCSVWKAAVQAELEREDPGYPAISSMKLFRAPTHSAIDPMRLCQSTVDLHIAIVSAPGRPDVAVTVFYDAAATIVAIPFAPACGPER